MSDLTMRRGPDEERARVGAAADPGIPIDQLQLVMIEDGRLEPFDDVVVGQP